MATEGPPKHSLSDAGQKVMFDEIRALYEAGSTVSEISRKLGLGLRRVHRWVCRIDFPERNVMAPKPSTPAYFGTFLAASWAQGTTKVRHLFSDIRRRGYTGSFSHLARFVAPWRQASSVKNGVAEHLSDEDSPAPPRLRALDPMTGRQISPLTAAALCVKPRGLMTERQLASVDVLKAASTDFCTMRHLAMRLRGLLRGGTVEALNIWLTDARSSNIHGIRRFSRTVRQDMAAVTNAVLEPWSNGQVEGQINRLKMLKRAMYGRAGVDLLRARMFPLVEASLHRE
jgi:transposase